MPRHFPRRGRGRWFSHLGRPTFADDFKVLDEATIRFGEAGFLEWSTDDADANVLILELPTGGAVDVPVFAIGIGIRDTNLGLFNGLTQTTLAVLDTDGDSYVKIDHSADDTGRITVGGASTALGIAAATTNIAASTLVTIYGAATQIGFDSGAYLKIAVTDETGVTAITHAGSGATVTWTVPTFTLVNSTAFDAFSPSIDLGFDTGAKLTLAVTDATGVTAITHSGSGPTMAWTVPAFTFTNTTSNYVYTPDFRVGYASDAYLKIAVTSATGVTAITHAGSGVTVAWTAPAFTFTNSTSMTTHTPSWVLGYDAGAAMTIAVDDATGDVVITHVGSNKSVTWTAAAGFDFVGAMLADALTLSDVLTFSDGGTIDDTAADTLTITQTNVVIAGNLDVTGTTTTINSTTLQVDDKNIELGTVTTPSDTTADGGGITLKGLTDKTILWDDANDNWTFNQAVNLVTGLDFKINNVSVLNATTLGASVVASSLTSVGTLTGLDVNGATVSLDGSTSVKLISATLVGIECDDIRLGFDASDYMKVVVATGTGDVAITHTGTNKAVTWTAAGGFDFAGSITLDAITQAGDVSLDGATMIIDGSTSVRGVSAGFVSLEAADIRLGFDASDYMKLVTTTGTGALAITHVGGSAPVVTWAADSLDFTGAFGVDSGSTVVLDGATSIRGVSAGFVSLEAADIRFGFDASDYMKFVTTTGTGAVAISHVGGSAPAITWTADSLDFTGAFGVDSVSTIVLDGATSVRGLSAGFVSLEAADIRLGFDASDYMKLVTTTGTGAVAITHVGGSAPDITWAADSLSFTGDFSSDGVTGVIDGSTSVRILSAGFVSLETSASDIRFGHSATIYTKFAVADTSGNLTITHVGGGTDLVTWTAVGGFSFVGNTAITGTFGASGTLSVGLDATAGTLELYPTSTGSGTTTLTMTDNSSDTITNINIAAQTGARTYTVPDAGVSASFLMTQGAQTIVGGCFFTATLSVGANASAGTLELYPGTTNQGTTTFTMTDNSGDTITNVNVAAQVGAWTITVPDAGASSSVVLLTAGQTSAGTLVRADLTEEALAVYGISLPLVRQEDGIALGITETADTFNLVVSGDIWYLKGEISQGETETSESCFQFILPPEYVATGDVKVRIKNRCVLGSGTDNSSTLGVEVFEQDGNGAIGSDLVSTGAQTYAGASAWQTTDYVVDGSGLAVGDILNVVITANTIESGASNPIHVELDGLAMLLDIKG